MSFGLFASQQSAEAAWSPADEGGLSAWWRVEDLSALSDTDAVTTWADQSGNGRDLNDGAVAPTYRTGITPNGSPVVRFSGATSEYMATGVVSPDSTCSVFLYGKAPGRSATQVLFYHGDTGARGWGFVQYSTNETRGHFGGVTSFGAVASSSAFRSYGLLVNSGTDPDGTLLIDDASAATTNSAPSTGGWGNGITVGGFGSTYPAIIDVCEVVYFDHVLDSTARANLQNYFETKYAAL